MAEGAWIDPSGKVFQTYKMSHQSFATNVLAAKKMKPSAEAKKAAKASKWARADAGPEFFELLKQGWVRQRGCDFTVWRLDGPTAMSIAIGAKKFFCPKIVAEELTTRGQGRVEVWPGVRAMVREFNGLHRKSAKKAAKRPRCK